MTATTVIMLISAALMLFFSVYAVMQRSILRAAVGLALSSASLAILFFALGGHLAAIFELSVCSGLVTVIFISGISLSNQPKEELQQVYKDDERNRSLPVVLILVGAVLVIASIALRSTQMFLSPDVSEGFSAVFWNTRQADIWGQIAAILCGGIAMVVLFREERR